MSGPRIWREARNDNVGLILPEYLDYIRKYFFFIPNLESFIRRLRKAKVDCPCKKLLTSVDAPGGQKFLRTDQSQQIADFGTNQILPAISPGHGQVCRFRELIIRHK